MKIPENNTAANNHAMSDPAPSTRVGGGWPMEAEPSSATRVHRPMAAARRSRPSAAVAAGAAGRGAARRRRRGATAGRACAVKSGGSFRQLRMWSNLTEFQPTKWFSHIRSDTIAFHTNARDNRLHFFLFFCFCFSRILTRLRP